ncbi:MAG: leucine-rich repeat domain-containing protein [Simkaniaceae bacterium]|nr:leucine-rich repeat domain-containing protein [Simkaniaceae bacterium]
MIRLSDDLLINVFAEGRPSQLAPVCQRFKAIVNSEEFYNFTLYRIKGCVRENGPDLCSLRALLNSQLPPNEKIQAIFKEVHKQYAVCNEAREMQPYPFNQNCDSLIHSISKKLELIYDIADEDEFAILWDMGVLREGELSLEAQKFIYFTKCFEKRNQLSEQSKSVEHIGYGGSKICFLPEVLGEFKRAVVMNFCFGFLREFPPSFNRFEQLISLNLSGNPFEKFPEGICENSSLNYLLLASCRLREIPEGISRLTNLVELELSKNSIEILPEQFNCLSNLIMLNLEDNPLKGVPRYVVNFPKLRKLSFTDYDAESDIRRWRMLPFLRPVICRNLAQEAKTSGVVIEGDLEKWGDRHLLDDALAFQRAVRKSDY